LNPEEYLFKARKNTCFFVIHKTGVEGGQDSNMYMLGDLFLQHFYSVYDFDKDEVSIGVNSHSKDKVHMYSSGNRPDSFGQSGSIGDFLTIDSIKNYITDDSELDSFFKFNLLKG
jgi:hypothetical protein